jgi:tetratricopeptide (TPR) repeat protein
LERALKHLGRYDEAEELLQRARVRFGMDPGPLSELASVAEARGDIPAAVQRWKDVLARFPLDIGVLFIASEAFERLGEPAEAEATLRAAIDRFPTELRPHTELARLLHLRLHEFAAAAEAWAAIRQTFPDNDEAYLRGAEALRSIGRADESDSILKAYKSRSEQAT